MSNQECPQPAEIVAQIRNGSIGDDFEAHLAGCEECKEVAEVVHQLAPLKRRAEDVPPFSHLYWRAQARSILGKRSRSSARAATPLRYFHRMAGGVLVAAAFLISVGPLIIRAGSGDLLLIAPLLALLAATTGGILLASGTPGTAYTSEYQSGI